MSLNSTFSDLLDDVCSINIFVYISFCALKFILIVPLCAFVLYAGHRRWQQQRSFKATSHSDVFTFHMAVIELIWGLASILIYCGINSDTMTLTVGMQASGIAYYGEIFFHVLTCVDRYLAVVHPITYLGLRNTRGVRIRNISIGCVWVLSIGLTAVTSLVPSIYTAVPLFCVLALSIIIISFCSLSVLCVLIRPRPGEGGGEKETVDQSKLRAFYTITIITCAVWLWFVGAFVTNALQMSPLLSSSVVCLVSACLIWFNLPSCFVLPLLYLHRTGKLSCYCYIKK